MKIHEQLHLTPSGTMIITRCNCTKQRTKELPTQKTLEKFLLAKELAKLAIEKEHCLAR